MPPPNLAASLVAGFLALQLALPAGASRAAGAKRAVVYSSPWCRCLDTA